MSRDQVWSKGDTKPAIKGTAEDDDGVIADLDLASIKFYMKNEETGNMKIDGKQASVVDASTGEIKYEWESGDTDTVGTFETWFVLTFSDGEMTVPNAGNKPIEITERGE